MTTRLRAGESGEIADRPGVIEADTLVWGRRYLQRLRRASAENNHAY